jgi:hypothetical protein
LNCGRNKGESGELFFFENLLYFTLNTGPNHRPDPGFFAEEGKSNGGYLTAKGHALRTKLMGEIIIKR